MRRIVCSFVTLATLLTGSGCAASTDAEIRSVLNQQTAAWNRGDIDGFMHGYWKSDDLTFESSSPTAEQPNPAPSVTRGWQATLDRYRTRYPTPERMGRLSFEGLSIDRQGKDRAEVLGRYRVHRTDGDLTGRFTLDMRRIDGHWVIVRDVTVADPPPT